MFSDTNWITPDRCSISCCLMNSNSITSEISLTTQASQLSESQQQTYQGAFMTILLFTNSRYEWDKKRGRELAERSSRRRPTNLLSDWLSVGTVSSAAHRQLQQTFCLPYSHTVMLGLRAVLMRPGIQLTTSVWGYRYQFRLCLINYND